MLDRQGRIIKSGDQIRLMSINKELLAGLSQDEVIELQAMIGDVFNVTTVTDCYIHIEKYIEYDEDKISVHELYLYHAEEFELIV